jgi:hypothetical protein
MSYGAGKEILEKVRVSVLILIGWFRDEICVYLYVIHLRIIM